MAEEWELVMCMVLKAEAGCYLSKLAASVKTLSCVSP